MHHINDFETGLGMSLIWYYSITYVVCISSKWDKGHYFGAFQNTFHSSQQALFVGMFKQSFFINFNLI